MQQLIIKDQGSTFMMLMSMWYAILVPFFSIMMVVGNSHRNTHDSDEEIEVDNVNSYPPSLGVTEEIMS